MTKVKKTTPIDRYMDLIRRLPLRPLSGAKDYDAACRLYTELLTDESSDSGTRDYTEVLGRLIRDYDEKNSSVLRHIAQSRPDPIDLLKFLVDQHGMNTIELGKLVGGSGQASMLLSGKRQLSKSNIRTLSTHFGVSPALFFA